MKHLPQLWTSRRRRKKKKKTQKPEQKSSESQGSELKLIHLRQLVLQEQQRDKTHPAQADYARRAGSRSAPWEKKPQGRTGS